MLTPMLDQAQTSKWKNETQTRGREWLEATFASIADAVIATDTNCVITSMNAVAERLTGWTIDEACGKQLGEVLVVCSRATRARVDCPVARLLREGDRAEHTLPADAVLVSPDGTEKPIDDGAALIRAQCGSVVGAVIVFRDATPRRREMERLAFLADASVELNASLDYEKTLSTVANLAVPAFADFCQVVMVVDGVPRPLASAHADPEKAALAPTHYDPCELDRTFGTGHVIATGEPKLVSEVTPAMIDEVSANGTCGEWLRQLKPRSYIGVPLKRGQETIGAITLVMADSGRCHDMRDLNVAVALAERAGIAVEHARLFEELRLARAEADARRRDAELANRSKDEFLAVLGHELRNPLAPIVMALELMKRRAGCSRESAIVERQVKHLIRLVDDLLDVSRILRSKAVLTKERVGVAQLVADGVALVSPLLEQRRHFVTVDVQEGIWVQGDPVRLAQVVSNLMNNAAKYSPPGAPISVEAHCEGNEVVLRVRDTGMGIDPSVILSIFEPFVQSPQALDRAQGGLGLGLAIVRGLVHLHGGSVSAHSEGRGRGSEFVVRLPACVRDALEKASDVRPRPRAPTPRGERILVVDDNADAAALLVEGVRMLGYEAVEAPEAVSALALASSVRPAVALLDIGLPVIDGYDLARRLRELDGLADIKLVAVSGYGLESDRARSAAAGFDEHLVKPVTIEAVEAVIERLTRSSA
jgi:PAS domain S-box-containing protein